MKNWFVKIVLVSSDNKRLIFRRRFSDLSFYEVQDRVDGCISFHVGDYDVVSLTIEEVR